MPFQFDTALRAGLADFIESDIGPSPIMRTYTGAIPANVAAARTGTLAGQGTLPSDWLTNPGTGLKALLGTWNVTGQAAAGSGVTLGYFTLFKADGTTAKLQGTITVTGGGGDMTVDNTSLANAQTLNITAFNLTIGGA